MIHREILVDLGERSYPIYVGSEMLADFTAALERHNIPRDLTIITDRNIAPHYLRPLEGHLRKSGFAFHSIIIPPGESQKCLARANSIFTAMLTAGVGRRSAVLALGGGVIGDLAGFVAATYHRGVQLIHIPTTLLSQVDSSIGGKTAVNHPLGKNMIGAFYQPTFVWTDIAFLTTLPAREVACGLGEIIKYGVIRDPELFAYLEENVERVLDLDPEAVLYVQSRCCGIKARLTHEDERERGVRVILNFGHTVGHALEAAGRYRMLKHGEAVLLGMVAETYLARTLGLIDGPTYNRIVALIRRVPLKRDLSSLTPHAILQAMGRDKKSISGRKRFVLPTRVGDVKVVEEVDAAVVRASLRMILEGPRKRNRVEGRQKRKPNAAPTS